MDMSINISLSFIVYWFSLRLLCTSDLHSRVYRLDQLKTFSCSIFIYLKGGADWIC